MGLCITGSVSLKGYSYGYSALHLVRWLALLTCGFPEKINGESSCLSFYPNFAIFPTGQKLISHDVIGNMLASLQVAGYRYPNLLLHSDCEGKYTPKGQVLQGRGWLTGNSKELLGELKNVKKLTTKHLHKERAWAVFNSLFEVVKDEVENGKGILKFH